MLVSGSRIGLKGPDMPFDSCGPGPLILDPFWNKLDALGLDLNFGKSRSACPDGTIMVKDPHRPLKTLHPPLSQLPDDYG